MAKEIIQVQLYNIEGFNKIYFDLGLKKIMSDQELAEVYLTTPLVFNQKIMNECEYLWGKIKNQAHPFDIVIAKRDETTIEDKKVNFSGEPIFVQVKQLYIYGQKDEIDLENWTKNIKKQIEKIDTKLEHKQGVLYLANRQKIYGIAESRLKSHFENIQWPKDIPYLQVVICISLTDDLGVNSFDLWQIYPRIEKFQKFTFPKK